MSASPRTPRRSSVIVISFEPQCFRSQFVPATRPARQFVQRRDRRLHSKVVNAPVISPITIMGPLNHVGIVGRSQVLSATSSRLPAATSPDRGRQYAAQFADACVGGL